MAQQVVISFNANANFSDLVGEIQRANAAIGALQTQLNGLGSAAFPSIQNLNKQFIEGMRNSRLWSSSFVDVTNETKEFGRHLDTGRLKLKDYFREFNLQVRGQRGMIRRLAEEQVKLQRSILTTTLGPQGESKYMLSTPTGLNKDDSATMKALRAEQFKIIGRSIQGVSTELINLGKNTQWAGRQLTVGLTVPLTMFAAGAATAFKEVDKQLTRLAKVYGDVGGATAGEIASIRSETQKLATELAKSLGAPAQETIALAADIAATGKQGNELLKSVSETTRLSVLGEVDRQAAMEATLSLQNAFNMSTQELADSINFLNAVENQTSTSLQDLITAIPKAGPVVKSLGGDVKDLSLFLSAMIEGGINASEAANALKSGLASIINPTKQTTEVLSNFGIDIQNIVNTNAGDLVGTVVALQKALENLDPLSKSKAIEQLFGKFQFARMSALFDNLGKSGSQTLQVMDLMKASTVELATLADRELKTLTESASGKFQRQIETLRANLATTGESFLGIFTKVLNVVNKVIEGFNNLPDGVKNVITIVGALVGLAGPLIMLSGVFLNFFGYLVKSVGFLGRLFTGTKKFEMLDEQLMSVKLSGDKTATMFYDQAKAADVARMEIDRLIESMQRLMEAQNVSASGTVSGGGMSFMPERGTKSGDLTQNADFSHLIPDTDLKKMYGRISTLMVTQGAFVPQSRDYGLAAPFQEKMGKNMPGLIVQGENRSEAMRPYAEKFGALTLFNKLNEKELEALMPSIDRYAKSQSQQLATWRVFQNMNEKQAQAIRKQMLDAMQSGDAEKALQAIRSAAAAQGISFDQIALDYENIGRAAYSTGTDLESRSRAVVTTFGKLEAELLTADTNMQKWLFTESGEVNKLAKNLSRLTGMAVTQVSSIISAEESKLSAEVAGLSQVVKTKAEALQGATVRYINGVAVVFDAAGIAIADQPSALKNAGVRAAIKRLDQQVEELTIAARNRVVETTIALEQAELAVTTGTPAATIVPAAKGTFLGRIKGGVKGAFTGRGGLGTSMAMMGLGMGTTLLPTGGVGDVAGGAMMGASMGMMFGPVGAAVGAALGGLIPIAKMLGEEFTKLRNIAQLNARQYQIDKEYAQAAGLNLKTIADLQLQALTGQSEEATSALQMLAQAASEAAIETSTGTLREATKKAGSFKEVQSAYENQYLAYIAAGASEKTAKLMMAAILKSAGKEGFSTDLNMTLAKFADTTATQATNMQLKSLTGGGIKNTAYGNLAQSAAQAGSYMDPTFMARKFEEMSTSATKASVRGTFATDFMSESEIKILEKAYEAYQKLNPEQKLFAQGLTDVAATKNILDNALANQSIDDFRLAMTEASDAGTITSKSVQSVADSISGLGGIERTALKAFAKNGIDAANQMTILKLRTQNVITDISTLNGYNNTQIKIYLDYIISEQKVKEAENAAKGILDRLQPKTSTTSGAGESAQKKALQAKLKALQEEERVEKNIAKLKELQLKYDEKRKKSVVDYLTALEAGDMEGALRAQLQMEQDKIAQLQEQSNLKKEIARDDEKARIQAQIDAIGAGTDATNNLTNNVKKTKDELTTLSNNIVSTFGTKGNVATAIGQFKESPELKSLIKKMKDAGYSQADIDEFVKTLETRISGAVNAAINKVSGINPATITGGKGTSSNPLKVGGVTPNGFRRSKEDSTILPQALDDTQKRQIVSDLGLVDGQYFTVGNEVYRVEKGSAVRQKNLSEKGWGPDTARSGKWSGGMIRKYGTGGFISGPGNTLDDIIPIMASNKEFMMRAKAVEHYGVPFMESINGLQYDPSRLANSMSSGPVSETHTVAVNINSINITEPGASADEIIAKIKKDLGAAVKRSTDMRSMVV